MSIRDFSDEEMRLLARVIRREQQTVRNPPSHQPEESQDYLAPEIYIAKLTSEVTALVAGTGNAADQPGYTTADIYRIVSGDSGSPELAIAFETNRRVYNVSTSSVGTSDYLIVARDKYGHWIAVQGGGSTIPVRITQVVPGTGTGTGTGTNSGDPVAVYRTSHPDGLTAIMVDEDLEDVGDEFTIYADELVNVHYTDSIVRVQRNGSKLQIVTTGENNWEDGFTGAAIDVDTSVGTEPEETGPVQLFSNGPVVFAGTSFPIATDTFCQVRFDNQAQKFRIGDQTCDSNGGAVGT